MDLSKMTNKEIVLAAVVGSRLELHGEVEYRVWAASTCEYLARGATTEDEAWEKARKHPRVVEWESQQSKAEEAGDYQSAPAGNRRSSSYHEFLLASLREPAEALAYLSAAVEDSPAAAKEALRRIAEAWFHMAAGVAPICPIHGTPLLRMTTLVDPNQPWRCGPCVRENVARALALESAVGTSSAAFDGGSQTWEQWKQELFKRRAGTPFPPTDDELVVAKATWSARDAEIAELRKQLGTCHQTFNWCWDALGVTDENTNGKPLYEQIAELRRELDEARLLSN